MEWLLGWAGIRTGDEKGICTIYSNKPKSECYDLVVAP